MPLSLMNLLRRVEDTGVWGKSRGSTARQWSRAGRQK
jgi:hypothetical protein